MPLGLGVLALIAGVTPIPGHMFLLSEAMNAAHILFFGLFAVVVLNSVRSPAWALVGKRAEASVRVLDTVCWSAARVRDRAGFSYLSAALVAGGLALLIEVLQAFSSRDADIMDLVRDGAGIVGFLLVYAAFDKQAVDFWNRLPRYSRAAAVLVALVAVLAALAPLAGWVRAYWLRDEMFPVLLDFEMRPQALFLGTSDAKFSIVPTPSIWPENVSRGVGRVELRGGEYPGLMIDQPSPDWSRFDTLRLSVFLDHPASQTMVVRIDDIEHDQSYADRFNGQFEIHSGVNELSISLLDVKAAPEGREMDMTRIHKIVVFALLPKESYTFYLDDIGLE